MLFFCQCWRRAVVADCVRFKICEHFYEREFLPFTKLVLNLRCEDRVVGLTFSNEMASS
jgi:hypothetical protein